MARLCPEEKKKEKGSLDTIIAQQEKRKRVLVVFTQKNKKVEIEGGEKKIMCVLHLGSYFAAILQSAVRFLPGVDEYVVWWNGD